MSYDNEEHPDVHEYVEDVNIEGGITLRAYGLKDDGVNMARIRQEEGEDKFFLRQLILSYHYFRRYVTTNKLTEKLGQIGEEDFKHIHNNILPHMTFDTKKSPIGLIVAYHLHGREKETFINDERWKQLLYPPDPVTKKLHPVMEDHKKHKKPLPRLVASDVIEFPQKSIQNYNTRWIDLFRYIKFIQLLHPNQPEQVELNRLTEQSSGQKKPDLQRRTRVGTSKTE